MSAGSAGGARVLTCEQAIALMSEYVEALLTPDVVADLEAHLAACAPCVAYLRTFARTRDVVAGAGRVEMPEELKERLRAVLLRQLGAPPAG